MSHSETPLGQLFATLDARPRPEDVAVLILEVAAANSTAHRVMSAIAPLAASPSYMSADFHRCTAKMERQLALAAYLFDDENRPAEPADLAAVRSYLVETEKKIAKTFGKNDFKLDRLNKEQREARGIDLSRRQYNKRFRLAAKLEFKANQTERERWKRVLALASKSRLAAQLTWEAFSADVPTACFIAYFVARSNLRSIFTVNAQTRPYDEACDSMMKVLKLSSTTNRNAIAYAMPDEDVVALLTDAEKGELLGRFYELLKKAGEFLAERYAADALDRTNMIVRRGNDSSTWNLTAGAWNKLRDGWFNLCHAMGADSIVEQVCFGKVMRLMAADVARWHEAKGGGVHPDTRVWGSLPLPWQVMSGEATCTKEQVKAACVAAGIDPLKSGWLARGGEKYVEAFSPTPELVHGVVVASPSLALVLRKARIFSGQPASHLDAGSLRGALESRQEHWNDQNNPLPPERGAD